MVYRFTKSASLYDPMTNQTACKAAENAKLPYKIIDHNMTISSGHIAIGNMHIAKGLEFRAVVVMACDD
jgi:hypothetical protein